jgi:hypothetical protein
MTSPSTPIAWLLSGCLVLALAACGGGGSGDSLTSSTSDAGGSSSGASDGGSTGGSAAGASFFLPYRLAAGTVTTRLPHLALDDAGGVHTVYAANAAEADGRRPAYYAYCASACDSAARFTLVALGDGLGDAQLQLDPAGHPRVLLREGPDMNNDVRYEYFACDADCTDASSWRSVVVATVKGGFYPSRTEQTHAFALDAQGRPRFVFTGNGFGADSWVGTLLAACDADCLQAGAWHVNALRNDEVKNPVLAIGRDGLPRIVWSRLDVQQEPYSVQPVLEYLSCDRSDCSGASSTVALAATAQSGSNPQPVFALRLNANDQPRLALYTGTGIGGSLAPNQLHYLGCDSACADDASAWHALDIGLPDGHGDGGVDLALDAQGRPRIAYRIAAPTDELALAVCDSGCDSSAAGWTQRLLPSTADAEREFGHPAREGCPDCVPPIPPCPDAFWDGGYWPSIALDAQGHALIAYELQIQRGGGQCSADTWGRFSRLVSVGLGG